MDPLPFSPRYRKERSGAYTVVAAAVLLAGTIALMRWGPALPELVFAAEPISEIGTTGATGQVPLVPGEELEALTEPIEELPEPEVTETSPEVVQPGATTGVVAPEVVPVPMTAPSQALPQGRWVLFDRNGQPVDAVVEPWCIDMVDDCPLYGAIAPSCVWVEWLGQLRVRNAFRLSDGDPYLCYSPGGHDRPTWVPPPAEIVDAMSDAPYSLELIYWD